MKVNITALRYAVEVEKTGSISLAARNLFLGQPNVSKAIKELELAMGITIFKRTTRGVVPTQRGEEFLHYARLILNQLDDLEVRFHAEIADRLSLHVALPRADYITKAFADFVASVDEVQDMDLTCMNTNAVEAIMKVSQQECSMGVIRYEKRYENHYKTLLGDRDLVSEPIGEFGQYVTMSKDHPLANAETITVDELEKGIELIYGDNAVPFLSNQDARQTAAEERGKRHVKVYDEGTMKSLLNSIPGAYVMTTAIPQAELEAAGLVQRAYEGAKDVCDALIYPRDYEMRAMETKFVEFVRAAKN